MQFHTQLPLWEPPSPQPQIITPPKGTVVRVGEPQTAGLLPVQQGLSTRYVGFLDEDKAREHALRLIVTGYSGSGKTTALQRLLAHGLRDRWQRWSEILILDGKRSSLAQYRNIPGVLYYGPLEAKLWAQRLAALAGVLGQRFERQEQGIDPGRWLLVIDEIQTGTRARGIGKVVRNSLDLIAEQTDALGDVLICSSQRELNAIPVSVRENIHAQLILLRNGYYYLRPTVGAAQTGKVKFISPVEALDRIENDLEFELSLANMPDILGYSENVTRLRYPRVRLFLGDVGSGKTYALLELKSEVGQAVYLDMAAQIRDVVLDVVKQSDIVLPNTNLRTQELVELALLALRAEPPSLALKMRWYMFASPRSSNMVGTAILSAIMGPDAPEPDSLAQCPNRSSLPAACAVATTSSTPPTVQTR